MALFIWVLGLVCSYDDAMLSGSGTNLRALSYGANNNPNASNSQENSRAGVEQLKTNSLCVNAKARFASDSKDKEPITKINNAETSSNACNLEHVVQDQNQIRVCLIIHVTCAMTPNAPDQR